MTRDLLDILIADEAIEQELLDIDERLAQLKRQREKLAREAHDEIKRLDLPRDPAFGSHQYWSVVVIRGVSVLVNVYNRPGLDKPPLERLNLQVLPENPDADPF